MGEDYRQERWENASEMEEKDLFLSGLVEDTSFILCRVEKNEFEKEQKTDQSLEEIRQKASQKKSFF